MDKGMPLNCNDAHTEFTDPVDGTVYHRRTSTQPPDASAT
jgi:hypothetical protein